MGNTNNKTNAIKEFNSKNLRPTNKHHELLVFDYLYDKYKFTTQKRHFDTTGMHYYDFFLVDYSIYIEIDESQHFKNGKAGIHQGEVDNIKNWFCFNGKKPLIRISYLDLNMDVRIIGKMIEHVRKHKCAILVSSKNMYHKSPMFFKMSNIGYHNEIVAKKWC
ncbi:MAG: hypothetical protein Faunusvirus5_11 [Faunusvirus sp.]|jgi:hypothetical protein|uniref:DUF559 domain-containing protein n=1 Tax=Faunusvirus sp. TaxID=2487766 RepID=A0A3G4ZWB0_9VIRU|nr:MAG: hypothetical protein Faunusvirus5_11 [Faunusvirus sp.]